MVSLAIRGKCSTAGYYVTCRGQWRSLWVGALVALPSGAGVAMAILGGNSACLVGVAISASLLPPSINCVSFPIQHPSTDNIRTTVTAAIIVQPPLQLLNLNQTRVCATRSLKVAARSRQHLFSAVKIILEEGVTSLSWRSGVMVVVWCRERERKGRVYEWNWRSHLARIDTS